jgi:hypothetical protein
MAEVLDRPVAQLRGISTVAGRYIIGDVPVHPGINLFACRLRELSAESFAVAAPVIPAVGEPVSAMFVPFGHLRGRIARQTAEGFVVAIEHGTGTREALQRRMASFREKPRTGARERRAESRHMPAEPRSVIQRPDGWAQPCLIVDYSGVGAAVSAAYQPEVGEVVTVGRVTAVVVRQFETGFAVKFFERQAADDVEALLRAPEEWREAVRAGEAVGVGR